MKFIVVDTAAKSARLVDCPALDDALLLAGLDRRQIDYGMLMRGLGYVVYEFGLFVPPRDQNYFAVGRQLIAGNAVMYGVGEGGETIDVEDAPTISSLIRFVDDAVAEVDRGELDRPFIGLNGKVYWRWPEPRP